MLKLPKNKVAIVPIFDHDTISKKGLSALSPFELQLAKKLGIKPTGDSHIHVPEQAKERCDQGVIKYVGEGVPNLKPGDYVIFSGYTGTLTQIEGEGLLIIMHHRFIEATIMMNQEALVVAGLYFKTYYIGESVPSYEPATYEAALALLTQAITEANEPLKIKPVSEPTTEELREVEDE